MLNHFDWIAAKKPYLGEVKPENLVFNANLQEFSECVTQICYQANQEQLSSEQAFAEIKELWHQLKQSYHRLGVGQNPFH